MELLFSDKLKKVRIEDTIVNGIGQNRLMVWRQSYQDLMAYYTSDKQTLFKRKPYFQKKKII